MRIFCSGENILTSWERWTRKNDTGVKLHINAENFWCKKKLADLQFLPELLVALVIREHTLVTPTGDTTLEDGNLVVLAARSFEDRAHLALREVVVEKGKQYANRALSQILQVHGSRVILVKRDGYHYTGWKYRDKAGRYPGGDPVCR